MWDGGHGIVPQVSLVPSEEVAAADEIFERDITFDRALPGLHKYLGGDLVTVSGRTMFDPGTDINMFAFYRTGVILVPGQSLPLIPYGQFESDLLQRINKERMPLVFLPGCLNRISSLDELVGFVGTTADLAAIRIPDEDERSTIHAIFVGRQRVRIEKMTHSASYPLICHGSILPELSTNCEMASHPLGWGLVPRSWSRFGNDPGPMRPKPGESDSLLSISHGNRSRWSVRRRSSRHSEDSTSSSSSYHTASCILPSGNPLSIFDSRLSTWRHFGPVNSGCISSACSSPNSHLDHFVGDSLQPETENRRTHSSAPELSQKSIHGQSLSEVDELHSDPERHSVLERESTGANAKQSQSQTDVITEDVELIMGRAVDRGGRPFRYRFRQMCRPRLLARRDVLAAVARSFVPLPVWVYRQYDVNYLVTAIQTELLSWNDTWHVDQFTPEFAVPFSYWLVQNLPIPGMVKARILEIDHVIPRLRALLDVIRRSAACLCVLCDANITSTSYIVCLAQEGSFQTYVNPAGILHDIVTVSQVTQNSVVLTGSPSEEYSWFPGYKWTIANCFSCANHLGWLFVAVNEDLRPRRFWGIRREAIVPGLLNTADWRPNV